MPLNTVFGPVSIDNSGFVNGLPTNITALPDASFALTVVDSVTSNAVNSVVYTAQGVLVGGGAAMPPADPQSESYPDIAGLANGGYALAWEEWFTVNGLYQPLVYTAVYDAQGNQISTPIEASSGLSYSELPEVTALNGDGYALTWHAANSNPDRTGDLWTRFFDSAGQPVTAAINLTGPLGGYDQLALAGAPIGVLANGNVVYSWRNGPLGQGEVYTAIYSADGTNVVGPTKLTNTPSVVESDVQLAVLSDGHYALSWQGDSTSTFQSQIYTAVYDSASNQILAPVVVSGGIGPEIVALSNGEYAIAWVNGDIYTAVFNAQGALVSGIVNLTNTGGQLVGDVEITALQSGYYALAWAGGVNALPDVFTAVVDAQGNVRVVAQNLSNSPGVEDLLPAITSQGDGTYAITWLNSHTVFLDDQSLAIFQFAPDSDSISIIGGSYINLDLSAIINVGGDVTISDNQNLVTLDLHNLVSVGGNFVIGNNGALLTITLPSLTTVSGDLDISGNTGATVIDVGGLTSVSGGLDISGNTSAGAIDVGGLTSVGGNLDLSGNTSATVIDVGGLTSVSGDLDISGNISVITIDLGALIQAGAIVIANNGVVTLNLSALVQAGGDVSISNNHSLLTVDMPELTSIGGDLDISGNTGATVIDASSLTTVSGDLDIGGNDSATVINVASLTTVGGDLTIDLAPDATVDASALGAGGGTVSCVLAAKTAAAIKAASAGNGSPMLSSAMNAATIHTP
jgi:large repetitive protein